MSNFIFTNRASQDLEEIWEYSFKKWSVEQAYKYYLELIDAYKTIAKSQSIG